jgi:hypothetical protein
MKRPGFQDEIGSGEEGEEIAEEGLEMQRDTAI